MSLTYDRHAALIILGSIFEFPALVKPEYVPLDEHILTHTIIDGKVKKR